jgi:hypothetical protein
LSGFDSLAARYVAQRLVTVRIAALTGVTALLAANFGPAPALLHGAACAALIVQLRIVDDLLDLAHDCRAHPARVLCDASRTVRLALGAAIGVALAATVVVYATWFASAQALLAFGAFVAFLYAPVVPRPARQFGLLFKYPALVLLGATQPLPAGISALAWGPLLLTLEAREACKASAPPPSPP